MNQTFDYIIIGAGSAGCLLANRLSTNPQNKVLLVEAGGRDSNPKIHIPIAFYQLHQTTVDWNFNSVAQPQLGNRRTFQPRGKVLGGSSSTNAMIYIRGHRADYDKWSELGNVGWSYEEVLPYFKKFESNQSIQDQWHGQNGALTVTNHIEQHHICKAMLEASQQAGFQRNEDFNGSKQEGVGFYQVTQRNGQRCSAAKAFLEPIKNRQNLTIKTKAFVHKILIKKGVTKGILFKRNSQLQEVFAHKEVVLCAGAFNSPHLLMLSGIGNAKSLTAKGVTVEHHLPGVGKNLQDHLIATLCLHNKQNNSLDSAIYFPNVLKNIWQYLLYKKGPFTSNIAECGGFIRTSEHLSAPDIQFHFAPSYYLRHSFENPKSGNGFSLGPTLLQPKSRGEVRLVSPNPKNQIEIDPKYYSHEQDLQTMLSGYKIAKKILAQPAFDPYRGNWCMPERNLEEDEEIIAYLREWSETLYHPVGTCKMGNDEMAVVDHRLNVHGIKHLRIADASIMPTIIRGNTNAPTMMIAEKAAEMILS